MKKSVIATMVTGLLITSAIIPNVSVAKENTKPKPIAKNIIVMISDGCGYNQIAATDYYQYGKIGTQVYEKFPFQYGMSTYSTGSYDPESAWNNFDYVNSAPTDSAAAATAMSTGVKTYDAAIGIDIDGNPLKHISEYFEEQGKSTGVVTSVEFSHATPAGFVAHNISRNNYQALANEMIVSSKTDVIMGAGNPFFDDDGNKLTTAKSYQYVGGQSTWDGLVNGTLAVADADGDGTPDPWKLIQTKEEFQALQTGVTPERVIGVPQVYTTLQQNRGGDKLADAYEVPFNANVPDLSEMADGALNVLDNNKKGFFLMIEGGAIDWAGHANQSGRLIEEEADFNKAVEAVNEWVKKNSNWGETLLIVTGDHETGYLTGPDSDPDWKSIINNGAGIMPGMEWHSTNHTNSLIPLFAKGDAARLFSGFADQTDPVRGTYIDNTEIAKLIQKVIQ
jgi:alkaline phosphatase